jgi:hypothetical protein
LNCFYSWPNEIGNMSFNYFDEKERRKHKGSETVFS